AVIDGINHLVIVVVPHVPLHADGLAVAGYDRLWIEALSRVEVRRPWWRLIARPYRDRDVVEFWGHVLRQVVDHNAIHLRRGIAGVQNRLPLDKTQRRRGNLRLLLQ